MNPMQIAGLLTLASALFLYILLVPRNNRAYTHGDYTQSGSSLLKGASFVGNEIYALLPSSIRPASKRTLTDDRTERLFQISANPWNLRVEDFGFFKAIFAGLFGVVGIVAALLLEQAAGAPMPWWFFAIAAGALGWFYPGSVYKSAATKRDLEFKRQLPEALDLIIISLSGGVSFTGAMREAIPNMQPGVLKDEFRTVVSAVDAGSTLSDALQSFADRAPNDSIMTFIKAVQEASNLNVSLTETLEARAEASRREFFAIIQNKAATLSSRMMAILTPTLVPAMLICVAAPAVFSLMATF